MDRYYVNDNPQNTGEHEIHKEGCSHMPAILNRTYLGMHPICQEAVVEAKTFHQNVDGCLYCCRPCHTR